MKRTIALLSFAAALVVTAFAGAQTIKAANCGNCCGDNCGQSCCQGGCTGSCCK